jgi:hypothetical protein
MALLESYAPPGERKPLGGYAAVAAVFNAAVVAFVLAQRRSGRRPPQRIPLSDVVLLAAGTHKLSRLIAKDRVTSFVRAPFTRYEGSSGASEVSESARGRGVRRAIGELLVCPYCVGLWVATGFVATYLRDPRVARAAATLFAVGGGADFLQQAWTAVEKAA